MNYSDVGPRSSEKWGRRTAREVKRMGDKADDTPHTAKGVQKILLTRGGVPKDLDHRHHALEEEGRMTPTLTPFV